MAKIFSDKATDTFSPTITRTFKLLGDRTRMSDHSLSLFLPAPEMKWTGDVAENGLV